MKFLKTNLQNQISLDNQRKNVIGWRYLISFRIAKIGAKGARLLERPLPGSFGMRHLPCFLPNFVKILEPPDYRPIRVFAGHRELRPYYLTCVCIHSTLCNLRRETREAYGQGAFCKMSINFLELSTFRCSEFSTV